MNFLRTDFDRLWAATSASHFGTMLGAITLTAIVHLDATPAEMGVLVACTTAPAIGVAVFAGVWVDRLPHRTLLLFADYGRFVLLLSIPVAALFGALRIEHLYVVAFSEGCLEVAFNLAYRAILPSLVEHAGLVDANARLRGAQAVGESVAPTAGGGLVQALGAPVAVACDAVTFLVSGLILSRLPAATKAQRAPGTSAWHEATQGLRTATSDPRLRAILGMSGTYGFFGSFLITLFALRILRDLDFSPIALGLLAVGGGLGSLAGARLVSPMTRRLGLGRSITVAYLLAVLSDLTVPLAGGPWWLAFSVLFGGMLFGNAFYVVENVASLSLRQTITPPQQLGRVNAVFLVANRAFRPVGALAAGLAAETFGVREGLLSGAAGVIAASLWLFLSPLPRMAAESQP